MSPKRSAKMVVKTTKKTVKETVEVSVVRRSKRRRQSGDDDDDDDQEQLKTVSTETTEKANQIKNVEISVEKEPLSIPIGTEDGDEEMEETPITPDQREVLKNDEQISEEVKIQGGEKDREQEDSMETYVTADQKQDQQAEEDGEEQESSKKGEPGTAVAKTREAEENEGMQDSVETNVTSDRNQDEEEESSQRDQPESEATKISDGEKIEEREDSMETNVTTDHNEDEEEEPSKKDEQPKSKEVRTREGKKSKGKRVSMDAKTTSDKKTDEISKKTKNKRKRKRNTEGGEEYRRYVHKVLKQVHPGMGASSKAMAVLNNLMNDMFERLAGEAAKLTAYSERKTLSSREIQGAVKLVLPGEVGRHAMAEGTKAVSAYVSSNEGGSKA